MPLLRPASPLLHTLAALCHNLAMASGSCCYATAGHKQVHTQGAHAHTRACTHIHTHKDARTRARTLACTLRAHVQSAAPCAQV